MRVWAARHEKVNSLTQCIQHSGALTSTHDETTFTTHSSKHEDIDSRGPRFGAAISSVLLLGVIFLALIDSTTAAFWLFVFIAALFAWGAIAGVKRHPYGLFFAFVIRPKLSASAELEPAQPPTFAQGIGFAVTGVGIGLHLLGVPYALVIAAAAAFAAAFLNAVFGYCIGCQLYVLLVRLGIGRRREKAAV